MARERFSFDDTIEFDKDELKPNNDIHEIGRAHV